MSHLLDSPAPVRAGLSLEETERIVAHLAAHFQVPAPRVVWGNSRRGHYRVADSALMVGPRSWRGVNTVVHEFAHHLDLVRRRAAGTWPTRGRRSWHGPEFAQALRDCAAAVWPCANMYSWETEYTGVKNWWARHGTVEAIFASSLAGMRTSMRRMTDGW